MLEAVVSYPSACEYIPEAEVPLPVANEYFPVAFA